MIKKYKPNDTARIEAMLFVNDLLTTDAAVKWAGDNLRTDTNTRSKHWQVKTLEGWVNMSFGSYLCKNTGGGFYPCDPNEFEKRWVEA